MTLLEKGHPNVHVCSEVTLVLGSLGKSSEEAILEALCLMEWSLGGSPHNNYFSPYLGIFGQCEEICQISEIMCQNE